MSGPAASVPLVNSASIARHAGHTVRIWGTLARVTEEVALLQAVDVGTIEVLLAPSSALRTFSPDQLVEVLAKVSPDGAAARELQSFALPEDKPLNMNQAQQLIELQYKFPDVFWCLSVGGSLRRGGRSGAARWCFGQVVAWTAGHVGPVLAGRVAQHDAPSL